MIPRMSLSRNEVPSRMFTVKCGAIPNQIRVLSLPRRRSRRVSPSRGSSCLVAVCSGNTFLSLMRLIQLEGIIDERTKLTPVSVTRRQLAVCIAVAKVP